MERSGTLPSTLIQNYVTSSGDTSRVRGLLSIYELYYSTLAYYRVSLTVSSFLFLASVRVVAPLTVKGEGGSPTSTTNNFFLIFYLTLFSISFNPIVFPVTIEFQVGNHVRDVPLLCTVSLSLTLPLQGCRPC